MERATSLSFWTITKRNGNGQSQKEIFLDSISSGEVENFIEGLLEAGEDLNSKLSDGYTYLSYAAHYGSLYAVQFLMKKGADASVKNSDGTLPLHIASKFGHRDISHVFLRKGIYVDSWDDSKCTPLHYAAKNGREWIVTFLTYHGADFNAVNSRGYTPLLLAAQQGHKYIVFELLTLGADTDGYSDIGWTWLHHAAQNGWENIVNYYIKRPEIERITRSLNSKRFSRNHHPSVCPVCPVSYMPPKLPKNNYQKKFLNINAKTPLGKTPLLLAAEHNHPLVVEQLIQEEDYIECFAETPNSQCATGPIKRTSSLQTYQEKQSTY
ncbi:hypothetical protein JTE90_007215 [Oedothorax gibbosus]|uniref:Alpha-latrotoxin n=1 Tax=Oedothorax gibbosus TaxID=931172 RepID=A0AAV6VL49_9ARAC|nr:hypothetical protein JTE90_007215 [Oedothorax gibbosus]